MAIRRCTCKNKYQDDKYGRRKRVMNPTDKGYRCTSCGREHRA